jgi:hypothetical protein
MSEAVKQMFSSGISFYKLALFELFILMTLAGLSTFIAGTDGMTDEKWRELGSFGHVRLYALILIATLTAAKGCISKSFSSADEKKDSATQMWTKGQTI